MNRCIRTSEAATFFVRLCGRLAAAMLCTCQWVFVFVGISTLWCEAHEDRRSLREPLLVMNRCYREVASYCLCELVSGCTYAMHLCVGFCLCWRQQFVVRSP